MSPSAKYQSPAEAAAEIRANLKKFYGITSRQVSVRARSFSMGSAIDIVINDPAVDIREVRNAADGKEKIDRDAYGEILSGGNRYLSVSYGRKAVEALAAANVEPIARLLAVLPDVKSNTSGPEVQIDGRTLVLKRGFNGYDLNVVDVNKPTMRPAWIPQPEYLKGDNGPLAVAEAILGMRGEV